jgi:hypothetical protein
MTVPWTSGLAHSPRLDVAEKHLDGPLAVLEPPCLTALARPAREAHSPSKLDMATTPCLRLLQ